MEQLCPCYFKFRWVLGACVATTVQHFLSSVVYNARNQFLFSADTLSSRQLSTVWSLVRLASEALIRPGEPVQAKYLQFFLNCKTISLSLLCQVTVFFVRLYGGKASISWVSLHSGFGLFPDLCQFAFFYFITFHISVKSSWQPGSSEGWPCHPPTDGDYRQAPDPINSCCSYHSVSALHPASWGAHEQ